jgi:hypothetical protein
MAHVRRAFLLIAGLLVVAPPCPACNVPVFRFALERWNKRQVDDLYSLHIFFGAAEATKEQRREIEALEQLIEDPAQPANLSLYFIDVRQPIKDPRIAKLYDAHKKDFTHAAGLTPFMVLTFPDAWPQIQQPLFVGPYDRRLLDSWLHSPLRQKIARRLLQGHSGIFLLVESGDAAKDKEKRELVESELARLEKEITLPERTDAPKDRLLREDIPLKVSFTLLSVSRADPREKCLLDMLYIMGSDDKLSVEREPVLIAFYGRGIAMVEDKCLIGKGINAEQIENLARFLVGACSCEIRKGNPGIEVLAHVNWDGPAPAEPGETAAPGTSAETTATSFAAAPIEADAPPAFRLSTMLWALGGMTALVLFGSVIILARRNRAV